MKNFIVIAVLIFTGILTVKAQFGISDLEDVYSVDQEIPSYFFPSSKNADNRRKAPVRGERNILERLLSLNDKTTAVLVDTLTDFAGGFHESYAEYYEGIEVEGARCTIHYDKEGKITSVNGNFRTINELNIVPAISEEAALQYALADIGAEKYAWEDSGRELMLKNIMEDRTATHYPKGNVVLYANPEGVFLAYKFYVETTDPVSHFYIYVDAVNGSIIGTYKAICEVAATTTVTTLFSGQRTITTDSYSGGYRLRDYTRGNGILTYDYSTGSDYTSTNNSWSGMSNYDRAALDVHWGVETTYDFYLNKFGRNSYDNNGAVLKSYVNKSLYDNACWNPNYCIMEYGIDTNNNPLVGLDVTAHELTHAVTMATSNLRNGESAALNEGLSDAFAVCVEYEAKPNNGNLIWTFGEDVQTGGFRNLSNPTCKFYHGTGWNAYGEEHVNGGVFGYWFYLLASGGSGTNEVGDSYQVDGIGLDQAIRICYLMNTAYLTSNSNYIDACRCSYLAAEQLGYTDAIEQMREAWLAVGVQYFLDAYIDGPDVLCGPSLYSVEGLPLAYDVSWDLGEIYNSYFAIPYQDNHESEVWCANYTVNHSDILIAKLKYHGIVLKTLKKDIFTHANSLFISGTQDEYRDSFSDYYPEQTFSYTASDAGNGYSSSDISVNADCQIHLESSRFKGMNISFEGHFLPSHVYHSGDYVSFRTNPGLLSLLGNSSTRAGGDRLTISYDYSLTMRVHGDNSCKDFTLNFVVSPIPYLSSNALQISVSGNTLYIFFNEPLDTPIGGGLFQQDSWTLRIKSAVTGQTVELKTVYGNSTTVNISSFMHGVYIVRAEYNGTIYSAKFYK